MHLFEIALGLEMEWALQFAERRRFRGPGRAHVANSRCNQIRTLLVSDVAGGGDHQNDRVQNQVPGNATNRRLAIESLHRFRSTENRRPSECCAPEIHA